MSKALRIFVSIGLLALVLVLVDVEAVWQVLRQVGAAWLAVAFAAAILDRIVTNYRWQALLAGRGLKLGFIRLFRIQLAANFIGSFLPGFIGVDAARITALSRSGFAAAPVWAATLVDRFSLALATLMAGAIAVLLLAHERIPSTVSHFVLLGLSAGGAGGALILLPPVRAWMRSQALPRLPEKFRQPLLDIADASLAYRHQPLLAIEVVSATFVLFMLRLGFAQAIAHACGVEISWVDLLLIIPVLWVVVMMPFSIGGLGIQDAGYIILMGVIGIPAPIAVGMSLLEHVIARVVSMPGVFFLGDVIGYSNSRKSRLIRQDPL